MVRQLVIMFAIGAALASGSAGSQGIPPPVPDLQSRIPAPLPPPPEPPVINGPLNPNPYVPEAYTPPRLRTFSDRVTQCMDQGSAAGLHGGRLSRYTRACANDH